MNLDENDYLLYIMIYVSRMKIEIIFILNFLIYQKIVQDLDYEIVVY